MDEKIKLTKEDIFYLAKLFLLGMLVMLFTFSVFLLGRIAENNFREFALQVCGENVKWFDNIYSVTYIKHFPNNSFPLR